MSLTNLCSTQLLSSLFSTPPFKSTTIASIKQQRLTFHLFNLLPTILASKQTSKLMVSLAILLTLHMGSQCSLSLIKLSLTLSMRLLKRPHLFSEKRLTSSSVLFQLSILLLWPLQFLLLSAHAHWHTSSCSRKFRTEVTTRSSVLMDMILQLWKEWNRFTS